MDTSSIQLLGPPELLHDHPRDASNKGKLHVKPPTGLTENKSATFLSTGNPCLDFFFHVVPNTPSQALTERLELAWKHDDLMALKLICHLRGVRGTGKSDKEGFYTAASWLHKYHPKTLACNMKWNADFGYFKDWRYSRDPDYRFLHDQISQVFADHLVSDMKYMNDGEIGKISLAAKWCPYLDSAFDKTTLLCESISKRVFPRSDLYPEYDGIEEAHYAYRVRDRLRKEVLVPLHKILDLPEIYMSSKQWESLPYGRVASVAITKYKKHFLKHDEKRFNEFLSKVGKGEAKIAAGALFPHEIIKSLDDGEADGGQVAELQWKRMVDDLSMKGKLKNCIAVCDVSGSMNGTPMGVCVALGLLLSELSEHPWKGRVITFNENPQLHKIEGNDLRSKTGFIEDMDWGTNTDFQKVFDVLLEVAIAGNLDKEKMIKKIFVFSDMEFDEAKWDSSDSDEWNSSESGAWNTDYEVIKRKFENYGYKVPEIVFWNLRESKSTPVPSDQQGVGLVSGFSKNLMSLFLDNEDNIGSPEAVMELALIGPEYKQLVVVD
ncbi:LOW QUALITY PROTEIN: hypothetical protein AQUCO_00500356v1 [Aquilegia coerulea]|uniref:DUF2828 domain-containing protein n=1 Tax=Aquilegia coerulea TaxID=218851 RepID=A0A2G5ERT4_AQUCA|nr:LOW QUALITY PROTEIN: hypothetical protein AQUCO_00500356v1 [Aquilegia coerulea]